MAKKKITTITSDDEVQTNADGMSQETENKKENIKDTLDTPNVVYTMEFYLSNEKYANYMDSFKDSLKQINPLQLKDAKIIELEYMGSGGNPSELRGVDIALKKIIENPEGKIILTSFLDIESKALASKRNALDLLLSKPNVKFIRLPFAPQELVALFDTQENKEEILKTISFKFDIDDVDISKKKLIEKLQKIDISNLKNTMFIDPAARSDKNGSLWDGIGIALNELQKDPEKKIILFSVRSSDTLKDSAKNSKTSRGYKLSLVCSGKNVRFFEYGEDPKHLEHLFDEEESKQEGGDAGTETAFQKVLEGEISQFLHNAGHRTGDKPEISALSYEKKLEYFFSQSEETKSEKRIAFEDRMIGLFQLQYPAFKHSPKKNNLEGILYAYKCIKAEILAEGTRCEGVFVDRDGTLYDNDTHQFNQNVINMIHDYESQGKEIVIWTLGDVGTKQKILDNAGLPYVVKSKTDYKGATVEIAIDNDSPELLLANAKVKAEKYVQV